MRSLIIRLLFFVSLFIISIVFLLIVLPFNKDGHNCAYLLKDKLLHEKAVPRIILVGGSNVAMGFDCSLISDSLNMNVVNLGVHAGIGLQFMMSDIVENAKENDIIVISPEYSHFWGKSAYGSLPLADVILYIKPSKIKLLTLQQLGCVINNIPGHLISRFMYMFQRQTAVNEPVYSMRYVNKSNGDSFGHWLLPNRLISHYEKILTSFNQSFFDRFIEDIHALREKKCQVYLLPPVLARTTYNNTLENIRRVETELCKNGESFIATPERYCFADTLFFDSPYHVDREGSIKRSNLFVDEFKFLRNVK